MLTSSSSSTATGSCSAPATGWTYTGLGPVPLTDGSRGPREPDGGARFKGDRVAVRPSAAAPPPRPAAVAVALAGPWHELTVPAGGLPPIADISAPSAIPALIRAGLNGGFLGIDDLFVRAEAVPGAYTDSAVRVVAAKTREYMRWLG